MTKKCEWCKKEYDGRGVKYCSNSCKMKGIGREFGRLPRPNTRKPKKKSVCKNCNKTFYTENWRIQTFCSLSCVSSYIHRGKNVSIETRKKISSTLLGIELKEWNGFSQEKIIRLRDSKEYGDWRKKVYRKDNFICKLCNSVGKNLNAHHIKSFAKNPELRFEVDNGVTLCKSCHSTVTNGEQRGEIYEF